jgi:hypothetical protein
MVIRGIIKPNEGRGAILCNFCRVIIKQDLTYEEMRLASLKRHMCGTCAAIENMGEHIEMLKGCEDLSDIIGDHRGATVYFTRRLYFSNGWDNFMSNKKLILDSEHV